MWRSIDSAFRRTVVTCAFEKGTKGITFPTYGIGQDYTFTLNKTSNKTEVLKL